MTLDPLLSASPAIQIHTFAAFLALAFGIAMFVRRKGTPSHRIIGRAFLALMLVTAMSAFFIRQINNGGFSWIHIFIPVTFFAAFETVFYIRKKNIKGHKRAVKGLFFGALLIPGVLSFLPGRHMWAVLTGGF